MICKPLVTFLISIFITCVASAQTKTLTLPTATPAPPPGNMKLLPGYVHEKKRGIDTAVGIIRNPKGIEIRYDIGFLAGNYARHSSEFDKVKKSWSKYQEVNGLQLWLTLMEDGTIYASFVDVSEEKGTKYEDYANFFSKVKSNEEITDFLMMVMTYNSSPRMKAEPRQKKNT